MANPWTAQRTKRMVDALKNILEDEEGPPSAMAAPAPLHDPNVDPAHPGEVPTLPYTPGYTTLDPYDPGPTFPLKHPMPRRPFK